jgi:hypothetical protein
MYRGISNMNITLRGVLSLFAMFFSIITSGHCQTTAKQDLGQTSAKNLEEIKSTTTEFLDLLQESKIKEDKWKQFFREKFDANGISKRVCGAEHQELIDALVKYLRGKLTSEMVLLILGYRVQDVVVAKSTEQFTVYRVRLVNNADETVEVLLEVNNANRLIMEIVIGGGIALIRGAVNSAVANQEKKGKKALGKNSSAEKVAEYIIDGLSH